jgi:hypothetical protein
LVRANTKRSRANQTATARRAEDVNEVKIVAQLVTRRFWFEEYVKHTSPAENAMTETTRKIRGVLVSQMLTHPIKKRM